MVFNYNPAAMIGPATMAPASMQRQQLPGQSMSNALQTQQFLSSLNPPAGSPMQQAAPSPEQIALGAPQGGIGQSQQMQNFLTALHQQNPQGASTNSFMNVAGAPGQSSVAPLVTLPSQTSTTNPSIIQNPGTTMAPTTPNSGIKQAPGPTAPSSINPGSANTLAPSTLPSLPAGLGGQATMAPQQSYTPSTNTLPVNPSSPNTLAPSTLPTLPNMNDTVSTTGLPPNAPLPNAFNGWSGLPTLSDETQKQQIKDTKPSLDKFMDKVGTWQYEYKHPEMDGKGTFYGPMAQELEKTEVGKSAVIATPRGKMVDTGRLSLINTSALSLLNKQQDRMQKQIDLMKKQLKLKG